MSALDAAKAILVADTSLATAATGGIWTFGDTGRLGLSRTGTPSAFDATGRIKPCILLKARSCEPFGGLQDGAYVSTRQMLEVWFYDDTGANLAAMRERVFALLHNVQLEGSFLCVWAADVWPGFRDPDLDASFERSEYAVIGKR